MMREILVMDCREREVFWRTLRSDYRIRFATTAEKGLEMLTENVSLVFLSAGLPDMDGMEVQKLIKKVYPSTEVIVITSAAASNPHPETSEKETGDCHGSPLKAEEMLERIRMLMSAGEEQHRAPSPAEASQEEFYPNVPAHLVEGVLRVRDFVAKNYSESLTLAAACKMASTSRTYFCHFFKRITGHSLRNYHHVVKVQVAKELLMDRRLSVKDVAHRLGYNDSNYFSTIYKRLTGLPPRRQAYGRAREIREEEVGHF